MGAWQSTRYGRAKRMDGCPPKGTATSRPRPPRSARQGLATQDRRPRPRTRCVSAAGPRPELAGVEYCPNADDLVAPISNAYTVTVTPSCSATSPGLAVDGALQEPHVAVCCAGEIG